MNHGLLRHAEEVLPEGDDAVPTADKWVLLRGAVGGAEVELPAGEDVAEAPVPWVATSKAVIVPKTASKLERSIFSAFVVPALEES